MAKARTYAPEDVAVVFDGIQIEGFAEGSMVLVEPNADVATKQVGADGAVTRSISADKSGRITVRLQQTSPSNLFLEDLRKDRAIFGFQLRDLNGETRISAEEVWAAQRASADFAAESTERQWVFDAAELDWNLGGND